VTSVDMITPYPAQGLGVINRGRNGDSVLATLQMLPPLLTTDRPGAVLLLSGYNDLSLCQPDHIDGTACTIAIDQVAFGVRDCIRRVSESSVGIRYVFVCTLTPPGPVAPNAPKNRRLADEAIVRANARIRQIVAAEGATLVDVYPLFVGHEADYVDTDGLHLKPAGYQILADHFFAAIVVSVR
jgi:lysophospholipase L1-like esterase